MRADLIVATGISVELRNDIVNNPFRGRNRFVCDFKPGIFFCGGGKKGGAVFGVESC